MSASTSEEEGQAHLLTMTVCTSEGGRQAPDLTLTSASCATTFRIRSCSRQTCCCCRKGREQRSSTSSHTMAGLTQSGCFLSSKVTDKRGALGCRLLLWFAGGGSRCFVVCHHEHCWWRSSQSRLSLSLPPMVVVCEPRDGTHMTCCFLYRGDVVLKMSTPRWPRPEQSAPFRLSTGRGRASIQVCLASCQVTKHQWRRRSFQQFLSGNWKLFHPVPLISPAVWARC